MTSDDIIALAADHAGFALKDALLSELSRHGYRALDLGTDNEESCDYPDYAIRLAHCLRDGKARFGILMCGTGLGMSMTANRFSFIRAALCHDETSAQLARAHNDANVLVLAGRVIKLEKARTILARFLTTPFEGGRHQKRVDAMTQNFGG